MLNITKRLIALEIEAERRYNHSKYNWVAVQKYLYRKRKPHLKRPGIYWASSEECALEELAYDDLKRRKSQFQALRQCRRDYATAENTKFHLPLNRRITE